MYFVRVSRRFVTFTDLLRFVFVSDNMLIWLTAQCATVRSW